ncbi:hypothetical protein ACR5MH_0210 (plasmid) [Streptomyces sp. L7]|uniref:hypothetical protein n=1 Tax=Actinomycetes TaxID=1760 RepID=UPI00389B10E7
MSRKKKQTKGNPANRAWRDTTPLGAAIQEWSEKIVLKGDEEQATVAAAVGCWVGAGDPGRLGLNQCTNACYQIQLILGSLGVEAHIVPVAARILEKGTSRELATVGSDAPSWSDGFARWTGHAVLALPKQGRILDPRLAKHSRKWDRPNVCR